MSVEIEMSEVGGANQVLRNLFNQCSETGRKWWEGSRASPGNELTAVSTYISGMAYNNTQEFNIPCT